MIDTHTCTRRDGFALALVLMVMLVVVALATAAATISMNTLVVTGHQSRSSAAARVADDGLELARALLNAEPETYPDSGFAVLEEDALVTDALGDTIPGVLRSTYAGPVGVVSGEYGVVGAVVSVARDGGGGAAIRRMNVPQESFARFAYFTDQEPSTIGFGGGDLLDGPVHSNDDIQIYSSGATFFGPLTTAGRISGRNNGQYREGYTERAPRIPMPEMADLMKLQIQAAQGGTDIDGSHAAPWGQATTRIEFVNIDLNGDGDGRDDNEGFVRIYQSWDAGWVVGAAPTGNLRNSQTCGHWHSDGTFMAADDHGTGGSDSWVASVTNATRRCYLGGAPELFNGFVADDGRGEWLPWSGPVSPLLAGRPDAGYLFPITRALNPDFKGVIFVDGDVAVSGVLRGRVTIAATGNIVIADDVTYSHDPAMETCRDILGLFAGDDVVVANTPVLAPWQRGVGSAWFSYGAPPLDERIHAFILTLNTFTVDDYDSGSLRDEECEGTDVGRGCLYLTGGIIQETRGAVGQIHSGWGGSGISGYLKRYSYDACGASQPPPYFPTTGRFARGTYYEVDPTGFDPDSYFQMLSAGGS